MRWIKQRLFYRFTLVICLSAVSMPCFSAATTLDAISVVEEKVPDPYVEGFKAYAKELQAQQETGDLQDAVDDFVKEISQPKFIDKELIK